MAASRLGPVEVVELEELLEALDRASDMAAEMVMRAAVVQVKERAKELLCQGGD